MIRKGHIIFQTLVGIIIGLFVSYFSEQELIKILSKYVIYTIFPITFGIVLGSLAWIKELEIIEKTAQEIK